MIRALVAALLRDLGLQNVRQRGGVRIDWTMTRDEWEQLAGVLRAHPDVPYVRELIAAGRLGAGQARGRTGTYGGSDTIHRTGTIDVETGPDGSVAAVWFRCMELPFRVAAHCAELSPSQGNTSVAIESVTYRDSR